MESAAQQPPRASRDVVGPVDTENDTASSSQRLMTDASYTRAARYTELRVLGAAAATAVWRSPAGRGALVDAAATAARYGVVAVQAARQLRVLDSRSSVLVTRLASASGIALVILAALKYQAAAVDAMRRLLRGFEPSPPDALRAYPEEDPPATGSSAGDAPGGRRGSEVDADAVGRDVSTAAVVSALSPAVLTALRGAPLSASAVASPSGGTPLSPLSSARAAEILRFIRLLRSTVYGIETEAILALYVHMDRLLLQPGEPLFRRGDGNEDGMYIVVRGQVGLLNDDAPPGEARRPLCVFGRAQTVGENALLATATLSGSSSGSGGRDDDAKPAVTATAAVPFNATRAATVVALGDAPVELLRLDRALFARFSTAFPSAVASFVLSTTSRQWRVAAYLLVDVFRLGDAWRTALEPPSTAPTFALDERTAALPLHPRHAAPVRMSVDALRNAAVAVVHRSAGETLLVEGEESDGLFVLLSGQAVGHTAVAGVESMAATAAVSYAASGELEAESARAAALVAATGLPQLPSGSVFTRVLGAGCIAGGQACIAGLPYRETVTAVTKVEAAWFPRRVFVELSEGGNCAATATSGSGGSGRRLSPRATTTSAGLAAGDAPLDAEEQSNAQQQREATQLDVLLGVGRTLMPLLRLFLSLGLQRLWLRAGEVRSCCSYDVHVAVANAAVPQHTPTRPSPVHACRFSFAPGTRWTSTSLFRAGFEHTAARMLLTLCRGRRTTKGRTTSRPLQSGAITQETLLSPHTSPPPSLRRAMRRSLAVLRRRRRARPRYLPRRFARTCAALAVSSRRRRRWVSLRALLARRLRSGRTTTANLAQLDAEKVGSVTCYPHLERPWRASPSQRRWPRR